MSDPQREQTAIERKAAEVAEAIARHLQADTVSDDARREAERDARIKAELTKLAAEGKVPPPRPAD